MENKEKLILLQENLQGKEMTLLQLDNFVCYYLHSNSLYDGDFNPYDCSYSYHLGYNEEINDNQNVIVEFDFLEALNDKFNTRIKVTNVWLD